MKWNRREWLLGTAAGPLASVMSKAGVSGEETRHIYTLDTGNRADRGAPVVTLRDGRILWFTHEPEFFTLRHREAVFPVTRAVVRESKDNGFSWGQPRLVTEGSATYGVLPHVALQLRSGGLIHIFVRYSGYDPSGDPAKSLNLPHIHRSSDGGRTWSEPQPLPTGVRYVSDVLSAVQISSGRVLYPFGVLTANKGQFVVSVLFSDDDARTWQRSPSTLSVGGEGFESGATEPSIVELPDGRLWMVIRAQTGYLWESFSSDRGKTWEAAKPSKFPSSNAPGTLLRMKNGEIVLVWNNHVENVYARQSLVLAATRDGKRFHGFREIDHVDFARSPNAPRIHVTYPFLEETPDGALLVSYNRGSWSRNRAVMARIEPSWWRRRPVAVDLREGRNGWVERIPDDNRVPGVDWLAPGGTLELEHTEKHLEPASGLTRNIPLLDAGEMTVQFSVERPDASLLWHDTFLAPGETSAACLRVRITAGGQVFAGAGAATTRVPEESRARRTKYQFTAYPVKDEKPCGRISPGEMATVRLRVDTARRTATLRVNDGPGVTLGIEEIFGFCHFGLAVENRGLLRLRRFEVKPDA